jgi:predicted deacetylase
MHDTQWLCVSVHDVAPATWRACERVIDAVREVAAIPLTLLVVPAYHGRCSALAQGFEQAMSEQRSRGNELALHGYFHRDCGAPVSIADWYRRRVYTVGEGEFAALNQRECAERLLLGRRWFQANGWPLAGFVPPAWLLCDDAWKALREVPELEYVTTRQCIHLLRLDLALRAPCLAFSVRNSWRRAASLAWCKVAHQRARPPVVRLALHPHDAEFPALRRAWQRELERLLRTRTAVTKRDFVAAWSQERQRLAVPERQTATLALNG